MNGDIKARPIEEFWEERKIQELNLDILHMTGKAWNQGERFRKLV